MAVSSTPVHTLRGAVIPAYKLRQRAGQAYAATDPAVWGVDRLNYCCRGFSLGCPPAPVPPKTSRAGQEGGSKAASSAVRPVARCHSGAVAAVYRCTANNFQVMGAVGLRCRVMLHHAALMGRCCMCSSSCSLAGLMHALSLLKPP